MIYLDNAATSWPKAPGVARAVADALKHPGGNPGRTSHHLATEIALRVQECREDLACLFGIANPLRICFTANTTEALNTAIKGVLVPGDHAICSSMEHNSVWRPLCALRQRGVDVSVARAEEDGVVPVETIARLVRRSTRLIVLTHASNVTGSLQPVAAVGALAHECGIPLLVDAAQTAGAVPIDVRAMHIDMLAFPGHKGLLGPQGTGGLYVSEPLDVRPLKEGGTGSVSLEDNQPQFYPDRLESGTLNLPGIAGLAVSVRSLLRRGVASVEAHERLCTDRLLRGLSAIDGCTLYGPPCGHQRAAVVSLNVRNLDPAEVAAALEEQADIACRPGWHCAALAHRTIGTEQTGTVRLSPGPFTRTRDVDTAIAAIAELAARN